MNSLITFIINFITEYIVLFNGTQISYSCPIVGTYNLTSSPTYTNVGTYTVYYQVSKEGYKTNRIIRQVDVVPTLCTLLGTRMPAQCEGAPVYQIFED